MVRHADEQVETNVELLYAFGQAIEEALVVRVVLEQEGLFGLPVAYHAAGDVVDRAGNLNSQMPCHAGNMA